ncbi:MAG TPA: hypothetical protein VHH73_16210 [Verrucomicrobiae bacterium]|nr:hypothetical protein [Verrucomicrobiae bacterium]
MKTIPFEEITFPMFAQRVGATFQVWWGETRLEDFKLVSAVPLAGPAGQPVPPQDESLKRYALTFESGVQRILGQASYRLAQEEMGAFELFVVPVGRGKEGIQYEAVINRL